jgi:hypothetical protein
MQHGRASNARHVYERVSRALGRNYICENVEAIYRHPVFVKQPHYRSFIRPLYRLAGGHAQPFSATLVTACVTDLVWHQILFRSVGYFIRDSLRHGLQPAAVRNATQVLSGLPNPGGLAAAYLFVGLPVALHKLGNTSVRNGLCTLAQSVFEGQPETANKFAAHMMAILQSDPDHDHSQMLRSPEQFRKCVATAKNFVAANVEKLTSEARLYWLQMLVYPERTQGDVKALYSALKQYDSSSRLQDFRQAVQCLNHIIPTQIFETKLDIGARAMQTDVVRGVALGLGIGAMWVAQHSGVGSGQGDGPKPAAYLSLLTVYYLQVHLCAAAAGYFLRN